MTYAPTSTELLTKETRMTPWTSDELRKIDKDVTFLDADHDVNDQIDAAYRSKYRRYAASTISRITSPEARSTTIKLVPR